MGSSYKPYYAVYVLGLSNLYFLAQNIFFVTIMLERNFKADFQNTF